MQSFIQNLKFARKFSLITVLAALMLAVPTVMFIKGQLAHIGDARREVSGLAPAGDAMKLAQLTQQHRGLSAVMLNGGDGQAAARQTKSAEVERALARAEGSVAALDDAKLKALVAKISSDWKALAAAVGSKSIAGPESFARHTALIADELTLVEDIAIVSGINQDANAGGYHLQAAVLLHLPRLTEGLGQMRARGATLLARGNALPEDKVRIDGLAEPIRVSLRSARKSLDLAVAANPSLKLSLATTLDKAFGSAEGSLRLVEEKILRAETLNFPSTEYFAAMTAIIDTQFELINAAFGALRGQLDQTVEAAQWTLAMGCLAIAALAAFGLWIMVAITRTTTASVGRALRLTQAVTAGDLSLHIEVTGHDEMGQLLQALTVMQASLVKVVSSVREGSESVATASAQIASGNNDLAARTEQQASALEQTAASMEELGSTVKQNADSARQANQLAMNASTVAVKGGE
ncbi:MAG: nitrate- and nitrite sensing domain-containing protein, partial [Rhodoferax sp.]